MSSGQMTAFTFVKCVFPLLILSLLQKNRYLQEHTIIEARKY